MIKLNKVMMKYRIFLLILLIGAVVLSGCSDEDTSSQANQEEEEVDTKSSSEEEPEVETESNSEDVKEEEKDSQEIIPNTEFNGILFDVPELATTLEVEEQDYPIKSYLLDEASGTNFNVLLEEISEPMELKEYMEIATANTGFDYLSSEYYTSNGLEWNESVSLNHSDNGTTKLNQRTFIDGNKVFIFTYGSNPDFYVDNIEVYKNITDSVVIDEK